MYSTQHPSKSQTQSAVMLTVQLGRLDLEQTAALDMLVAAIEQPFFNDLRTKQQLGYVVSAGLKAYFHTYEIHFLVQGTSKPPENVTKSILTFVEGIPAIIDNVTDEQFVSMVNSSRSALLEKPHSVTDKAGTYFDEISQRCYEFNRPTKVAGALQNTSLADLKALAAKITSPSSGIGRLLVKVYGAQQQAMPADLAATLPPKFSLLTDLGKFRQGASYLSCDDQAAALDYQLERSEVSEKQRN